MFFSSTTSRFWALIQMCMHQLGYKGSLHGYFASQCLLIWKFLPRNKLDWLCRLLMVQALLKLTTLPYDNQAPSRSVLSPSSVSHVVDGFKFAIKPHQYG